MDLCQSTKTKGIFLIVSRYLQPLFCMQDCRSRIAQVEYQGQAWNTRILERKPLIKTSYCIRHRLEVKYFHSSYWSNARARRVVNSEYTYENVSKVSIQASTCQCCHNQFCTCQCTRFDVNDLFLSLSRHWVLFWQATCLKLAVLLSTNIAVSM